MRTKTLSVMPATCKEDFAPARFEETFVGPAAQQTPAGTRLSKTIERNGKDCREIAKEALRRLTLGEALRLALGIAIAKYRETLFLQDANNLDTSETAMVLDIPVMAVQSRLR
jgi:DNA-directed RNA polymerase specialized sigma24 family protein